MKDIRGWMIESSITTIGSVYSHKLDAELVAGHVNGKVIPVFICDNSRLARLRNAREVVQEYQPRPDKDYVIRWLDWEIEKEEGR